MRLEITDMPMKTSISFKTKMKKFVSTLKQDREGLSTVNPVANIQNSLFRVVPDPKDHVIVDEVLSAFPEMLI